MECSRREEILARELHPARAMGFGCSRKALEQQSRFRTKHTFYYYDYSVIQRTEFEPVAGD
jgi:hypothetical protein